MNVVADLLALVAVDPINLLFEVGLDQVAEEPVQLDAGVVGPGEATAAQAAGLQAEVAAVFLDHDVGRDLRGAEDRVLRAVDAEVFGDAIGVGGVVVVPAGRQLAEANFVGGVAVDLVGRHVGKDGLGRGTARGLQQVQGADGVDVEVVEGARGGQVVAGLRGSVDDQLGAELFDRPEDFRPVADVELVVLELRKLFLEPRLVPPGIARRAEEIGAHVVVDAVDLVFLGGEVGDHLAADQAVRAGNQDFHGRFP